VDIVDRDDQRRFLNEIGVPGERGSACESLRRTLGRAAGDTTVDTIPEQVWGRVREVLLAQRPSPRELATAGAARPGGRPGGLATIAEVLGTADLELHATNDVIWDEIVSIEPLGVQEVYDATVPGTHNFIANGIATHNSIEQDADVVILLHRDDYYDKESPRAGEADFIVAKHRNGPTDTVTVAAQLHLSRFVDMAIV
jgi:replicative DNA helicase